MAADGCGRDGLPRARDGDGGDAVGDAVACEGGGLDGKNRLELGDEAGDAC